MNTETIIPLTKAVVKKLLKVKPNHSMGGGTDNSSYCYGVWMRHLVHFSRQKQSVPKIVAELGPGHSLGIGFCALLSGSDQFHALDIVKHWDSELNIKIFDELVDFFRNKASIPCENQFARVIPRLDTYKFPSEILTTEQLKFSLSEDRINAIRKEILDSKNPNNTYIRYHIPWSSPEIIENETVDFVYSQSVLQYIEDLDHTYSAIRKWLKPSGIMSHSIDLSSIGITKKWNYHWTFEEVEWKIIKEDRSFIISRHPLSAHLQKHAHYKFKILESIANTKDTHLKRSQLAKAFKGLSDEDLTTNNIYILSIKS
jgi:hypothetical protein